MGSPRPSPTPEQRLQRFLASCGLGSRRACEDLIRAGRVSVNGGIVTEMGVSVRPDHDTVLVDGKPVRPQSLIYLAVNKPRGVVCTSSDPDGRRTVLDLLPEFSERLYTVGRLDYDSEGLILVTNDGEFANLLMHPRHHVPKVYRVWSARPLLAEEMRRMLHGMTLEGERMRMLEIREAGRSTNGARYHVVLGEGKKRQIRRMFRAADARVLRLQRVEIGSIGLGNVPLGGHRPLTSAEVERLRREAMQATSRSIGRVRPV